LIHQNNRTLDNVRFRRRPNSVLLFFLYDHGAEKAQVQFQLPSQIRVVPRWLKLTQYPQSGHSAGWPPTLPEPYSSLQAAAKRAGSYVVALRECAHADHFNRYPVSTSKRSNWRNLFIKGAEICPDPQHLPIE
jgi:hypothetical protein